jgi:excisionase family DNA binding protein
VHEPELLDIAQAAALLKVSAASLRRWTNAGRLPCFRVGGRRERRFRRADLLALLERQGGAPAAKTHRHMCGFYATDSARAGLAADFLAQGLAHGGTCMLVAEPKVRTAVLTRLEGQGVEEAAYASVATAQLQIWEERFGAALSRGATSLWVVGDVSGGRFGRRAPFPQVLKYERAYDSLSHRYPVTTLCLYDARRVSGVESARMLHSHPDLFHEPVETLLR